MDDAQLLRPAGYNERRCIARDTLGLYGCIVTVGLYKAPFQISQESIGSTVTSALRQCLFQHPVLSTIIQDGETERPKLASLSEVDLAHHVEMETMEASGQDSETALQAFLERIHNEPLVERHERPQWRVHVLPITTYETNNSFYLAFASSHALIDGSSHMLFHAALLQALNSISAPLDTDTTWHRPSVENLHPPALDTAAPLPISWSFLLGPLLTEFLPSIVTRALGFGPEDAEGTWTGAPKRPERKESERLLSTSVRIVLIQPAVLRKVIAACRNRDARLTALMNRLIAFALWKALHARGHTYSTLKAETAIDMRRCLPDWKKSMANYVSVLSETLNVNERSQENSAHVFSSQDWTAVRTSTERLDQASRTLSDQPIALLRYISDFHAWTRKNAEKPGTASFDMSNIGVFDGASDQDEDWQVEGMLFSQSANGTGAPLGFNLASAKNGSLSIVVTWWPGMLSVDDEENLVEEVLTDVIKRMKSIAEGLA